MSSYRTPSGEKHYDYNWAYLKDGTTRYRQTVPSGFDVTKRRRTTPKDRNDLRGCICPGCGLTRSMTNVCDCNDV